MIAVAKGPVYAEVPSAARPPSLKNAPNAIHRLIRGSLGRHRPSSLHLHLLRRLEDGAMRQIL